VLENIEALFRHQMKGQGLSFNVIRPPIKVVAWADPDRTVQILTNLLSNAVKFTHRGGEVTVECAAENGEIRFQVSDNGAGIPPDELEAVFESFHQVDGSTTRRHGGTGLGLTISRRLAEMMGGSLALHSAGTGQGTTAHLSLIEYSSEHGEPSD